MKSKMFIFLAILSVTCVSALAFIPEVHTDTVSIEKSQVVKEENQAEEDETTITSNMPKSKLTLAILFLGGVGLAVFRRNSFL